MTNAASETFGFDRLYREVVGPHGSTPVLLLHGWGSSSALMRPIAEGLGTEFRIHSLDLPGHGHSPVPPRALGVPEHADLVAAYIRSEIGEPVSIVGHSNGGRIALYLASTSPHADLVKRLALISPSGIKPVPSARVRLNRVVARALRLPGRALPAPAADFFNDWITHSLLWRALGSSDYNALSGVMRETFVKTVNCHVDDAVAKITCPVVVLWGDRDTAVQRREVETLAARIPGCELVVLESAGHYGHLDAAAQVIAVCRSFLGAEVPA